MGRVARVADAALIEAAQTGSLTVTAVPLDEQYASVVQLTRNIGYLERIFVLLGYEAEREDGLGAVDICSVNAANMVKKERKNRHNWRFCTRLSPSNSRF